MELENTPLKDIETYLAKDEKELVEALQKLIQFKSEEAPAVRLKDGTVYPYGEGIQQAFEAALALGRKLGFAVKNIDNYGGHIEWPGKGSPIVDEEGKVIGRENPKIVGILGHLDVVPAGSGWDFEPYGGEVKDERIYGRGTTDNKGPVVSCLYAMKALKDAGYEPNQTIRLILGLDEETGMSGMDYYFNHVERPDYGFTPDADFPIINGEKGNLIFHFAKKFSKSPGMKGLELRSIKGGTAPNSVADGCRTVVRSDVAGAYDKIKEKAAAYRERTGHKLNVKGVGKSLELTTQGIASHGAYPEKGLNAISIMMDFLKELNFVGEDHNDFIGFYNQYIGFCLDGAGLGIDFEDEVSGKMVFNVGMIDVDPEAGKLTLNLRYPITSSDEEIFEKLDGTLTKYNMGLLKDSHKAPIYMEMDNPMVRDLWDVYKKHSGDTESQPLVIGGGTYARSTPNVVAYGAMFPGDPDLMHQKNESLSLERLRLMTKIYTEAIYKLSSGEYNI